MNKGLKIILLLDLDGGLGTNSRTSMPQCMPNPWVRRVQAESRVDLFYRSVRQTTEMM